MIFQNTDVSILMGLEYFPVTFGAERVLTYGGTPCTSNNPGDTDTTVYETSLPINFEMSDNLFQVDSNYFTNFNGGSFSVIINPFQTGINTSKWVGNYSKWRDIWAGSKVQLTNYLDFENDLITIKIYTPSACWDTSTFKNRRPIL